MRRLWRFAKWRLLARYDGFPDFALYRALLRHERMSRDELDALRLAKTRRLVEECLRHVPYYGDLMRLAGIRPERVRSPQDLEVLPLLDKETIRTHRARMLNSTAPESSYFAHTTGGSTGMPLDFYRGVESTRVSAAANMRSFRRMGWRPGEPIVRFWAPHDHETTPASAVGHARRALRHWLEPPDILFNAYTTSEAHMREWLTALRERRPAFFYGYASNLTMFAHFLAERGLRFEGIRGIASTALALFPKDRQLLRQVFPRATILDVYGSREIPGIAAECPLGTMHINYDLVHVEYLPVPGDPSRHRLVVTSLDDSTFPFIRYDIGDRGFPTSEPCSCGLPFPAMQWGFGKVLDSFVSPEGKLMMGGYFEELMYGVKGVHAYQFRQTAEDHIYLYVVPSEHYGPSALKHLAWVEERIRADFSPVVTVSVQTIENIPPTPAGKHQFVVSEVRHPFLRASADARN